ncbi:MAG: HAMP domain-containing sensor histidine kinase [Pseudomonadota bacterium]
MMLSTASSFKRRLAFTGAGLFAVVLVSAALIWFGARQHSYFLERSAHAQDVYSSYRAVSDHTYRKLSSMAEIVSEGNVADLEARFRNQRALRAALATVRDGINADRDPVDALRQAAELEHFNRIEALAEDIIEGSQAVRDAIDANDRPAARIALDRLRSDALEGRFNRLIDEALADELREVRETGRIARELTSFLTRVLPGVVAFSLLLGALLIFSTWRALTSSLNVFKQAVESYRAGGFGHRIQSVADTEFAELADAMNHMAAEIDTQRAGAQASQDHLEAQISARTAELERSNTKLASVSEMRRQFLADISHELRTPLTIIQGEADVALRGETKTAEQYQDALERVREQTVHTTRLVQDLLFIARTEDGKAPLHLRSAAVVPLVSQVCEDMRPLANERLITLVEQYADTEVVAELDAGRFKQVVTILIDNAIKYSYRDAQVEVSVARRDNQIEVQVVDDGIGLSYHQSNQVFSRFYRGVDGVSTPAGTGLGLPVAKAIVDAHGGSIYLRGESGRGTTATVLLPVEPQLRASP